MTGGTGWTVPLAFAALLVEAAMSYPDALFRRVGHPVTWMGALLSRLDAQLNRPAWGDAARRGAGLAALAALLGATAAVAAGVTWALGNGVPGFLALVLLCATLPAQRSLAAHVGAVADALEQAGVEGGRRAVSRIVGRDTAALDEAGVARAAVESLAENFSDGVVGPALFLALGGLPGGALYKAVNTADSMIGHRSERYRAFGWAAARFDDLVNLPASRLSVGWLLAGATVMGADVGGAWRAVRRDARRHRSPNAGWPEAALAGALGLQLGGPRRYGALFVDGACMGDGRSALTVADIRRALRLYRLACSAQAAALGLASVIVCLLVA